MAEQAIDVKNRVNLIDLARSELGEPKHSSSRSANYQCPFHREQKGASLVVWAEGWKCYGKCGRGGDAISFIQELRGVDFKGAMEYLGADMAGELVRPPQAAAAPKPRPPVVAEVPEQDWQENAWKLVKWAAANIMPADSLGRAYLQSRKIRLDQENYYLLGYVPGEPGGWIKGKHFTVPSHAISIPIFDYERRMLIGVKFRRIGADDPKYVLLKGSKIRGHVFACERLVAGLAILIAEGEIDAMILQSTPASDQAQVISIMGAGNARLSDEWRDKFLFVPAVYVVMDSDAAGEVAAAKLKAIGARAKVVRLPEGIKDVNDLLIAEGKRGVVRWIGEFLTLDKKH